MAVMSGPVEDVCALAHPNGTVPTMTQDLVGVAEVAAMLGISRQRVHRLSRADPDFPEPAAVLSAGVIWERKAIEQWAQRTGRGTRPDVKPRHDV
jgi:predicted DNA-binding transcriptional regulator AlpA